MTSSRDLVQHEPVDPSRWIAVPQVGKLYYFSNSAFAGQFSSPEVLGLVIGVRETTLGKFTYLLVEVLVDEKVKIGYVSVYGKEESKQLRHFDKEYREVTE